MNPYDEILAAFSKLTEIVDQSGVASANIDIEKALADVRAVTPPHHLFFEDDDPNKGRVCGLCRLVVPRGCRRAHASWCHVSHHTGAAASWCPVCGDCTCPRYSDGEWIEDGYLDHRTGRTGSEAKAIAYERRGECPLHVKGPH